MMTEQIIIGKMNSRIFSHGKKSENFGDRSGEKVKSTTTLFSTKLKRLGMSNKLMNKFIKRKPQTFFTLTKFGGDFA